MAVANTLPMCDTITITTVKSFMVQATSPIFAGEVQIKNNLKVGKTNKLERLQLSLV